MKRVLLKITLLAAFEPGLDALAAESLADAAAEGIRGAGALTCAAEYDLATVTVPDTSKDDITELLERLDKQFPDDGLFVGPLPAVHMLGQNGHFRNARLVRVPGRLELWLGFADERFPLLTFTTHTAVRTQ